MNCTLYILTIGSEIIYYSEEIVYHNGNIISMIDLNDKESNYIVIIPCIRHFENDSVAARGQVYYYH